MRNLHLTFDWHYIGQKQNFVGFSEYMNFSKGLFGKELFGKPSKGKEIYFMFISSNLMQPFFADKSRQHSVYRGSLDS